MCLPANFDNMPTHFITEIKKQWRHDQRGRSSRWAVTDSRFDKLNSMPPPEMFRDAPTPVDNGLPKLRTCRELRAWLERMGHPPELAAAACEETEAA